MTTGSKPFSIKIFLANGSPDGLRIVEKTNWTGVALCFPRIAFPDVKARDLFDPPGVYVLAGRAESEECRQAYTSARQMNSAHASLNMPAETKNSGPSASRSPAKTKT